MGADVVTALILASASPARLAVLRGAGIEPVVAVSTVDEPAVVRRYGVTDPADVALVLAQAKANDVADRAEELDLPAGLILGCDSVLERDGVAEGKPADAADAVRRWREMRGTSGVLHTGHWLIDDREDSGGAALGAVASTVVHFADVSDAEIDAYVATGEPLHVAGACTIDGLGGAFVTGIEGDHTNVIGLSMPLLRELSGQVGVPLPSLWNRPVAGA